MSTKKPAAPTPHDLQAAQEKQAEAHNALALLWRKVKAHSDWSDHVARRDASQHRVRALSATRAKHLRADLEKAKELLAKEKEEDAAAKAKQRARVLKTEEALAEEQDMRLKPSHRRKPRELTQEKLDEIAQQWVTVGRGGYDFAGVESPRYQKALMKAELDQKKSHDQLVLEQKKRNVAVMRATEQSIMNERAGATARYKLPVKKSALQSSTGEGGDENAEVTAGDEDDDENEFKGRKQIPGVEGCYLPEFHKSEGKKQRRLEREGRKVLVQQTEQAEKVAQNDIDAAAKLLILHAHMLRKACVEANARTKAAEENGGGEDDE